MAKNANDFNGIFVNMCRSLIPLIFHLSFHSYKYKFTLIFERNYTRKYHITLIVSSPKSDSQYS